MARDHFAHLRRHRDNPAARHLDSLLVDIISTFEDQLNNQELIIQELVNKYMETKMGDIDDKLKALSDAQAVTDTKIAAVKTDVGTVMNNVTALQQQLASIPTAGLTADQTTALQASIDHAKAINDGLTSIDASLNPAPPAAPAAGAAAGA